MSYGWAVDDLFGQVQFGGGSASLDLTINGNPNAISIVNLTCGINKVTVRLRNNHDTVAQYYDNIIVTAVRAP